jgi:hypothetical protein
MTLQQTIKSAVPRLQPYEIEALAVALEGAGWRKGSDYVRPVFDAQETLTYLKSLPKDTPEPRVDK